VDRNNSEGIKESNEGCEQNIIIATIPTKGYNNRSAIFDWYTQFQRSFLDREGWNYTKKDGL